MKQTTFLMVCIFLSSLVCSCSVDAFCEHDGIVIDFDSMENGICSSREVNHPMIEGHYVAFVDNQYVITISQKEAKKRGISKKCYEDFQNAVLDGNCYLTSIIDSLKCTDKKIIVNTCINNNFVPYSVPRIKSARESTDLPHGLIVTTGQERSSEGISNIPIPMASVECDCLTNAALCPVQVVIAESWNIQYVSTGIGPHVHLNAGFTVSNVPGSVTYGTTDSNGGKCA